MRRTSGWLVAACLGGRLLTAGDMSYQETTKITGGSALNLMKFAGAFSKEARKVDKPMVTSVSVKGNRMARVSDDSAEIIDLDAETMTHIDKSKQQYSVVTFAQMKEAMARAMERAKAEQAKASAQAKDQKSVSDPNVELGLEAHARKTGAIKQVSGLETNEVILTVAMNGKDKGTAQQGALAITNDMWMASDLPGYSEVSDFNQKFATKMGSAVGSGPDLSMFVKQAAASDAMKGLAKEMADVKGIPVLQVMRMGMTVNGQPLPAASEVAIPTSSATGNSEASSTVGSEIAKSGTEVAQQTAAQEASNGIRGVLGSSLGSAIGGFGGFGRKKKKQPSEEAAAPPPAPVQDPAGTSAASQSASSAVLVESTTQLGNFSRQVEPASLEVPAGYKLIPSPELKMAQE